MAFHVRDPETDALVREYAEEKRVGITDAIKLAVTRAREADVQLSLIHISEPTRPY